MNIQTASTIIYLCIDFEDDIICAIYMKYCLQEDYSI